MENQCFHSCEYDVRLKAFFHLHLNSLNFDHPAIKPVQFKFIIYFENILYRKKNKSELQ